MQIPLVGKMWTFLVVKVNKCTLAGRDNIFVDYFRAGELNSLLVGTEIVDCLGTSLRFS